MMYVITFKWDATADIFTYIAEGEDQNDAFLNDVCQRDDFTNLYNTFGNGRILSCDLICEQTITEEEMKDDSRFDFVERENDYTITDKVTLLYFRYTKPVDLNFDLGYLGKSVDQDTGKKSYFLMLLWLQRNHPEFYQLINRLAEEENPEPKILYPTSGHITLSRDNYVRVGKYIIGTWDTDYMAGSCHYRPSANEGEQYYTASLNNDENVWAWTKEELREEILEACQDGIQPMEDN